MVKNKFLIFLILLIGGCSHWDEEQVDWTSVKAEPFWFKGEASKLDGFSDNDTTHIFLDYQPFLNLEDNTINFVITTPVNSPYSYALDLVSGKRHYQYRYCAQKDVWDKFDREIYRPPFTEGIIPRVLDQLGKPQRVIVFGNEDFFKMDHADFAHRLRVVGAFVEEVCPKGNCMFNDSWQKRVVLVGVDERDRKFEEVTTFKQLKEVINWPEAKAFLENGRGRNFEGAKEYPAFRVVGEIKPGFALRYVLARAHLFEVEELKRIKRTCTRLYDYLWTYLGKMKKKVTKQAKLVSEMSAKDKKEIAPNLKYDKYVKETFAERFREVVSKYGEESLTCFEFVRPNKLRSDPERFWFLSYVSAFMKLQRMGYYYNCPRKMWKYNYFRHNGKRQYDPAKELMKCSEENLNYGFKKIPDFLRRLRSAGREHFRFMEYDNSARGLHSKMYSWINVGYKKLKCTKQVNRPNKIYSILPRDVEWKKRGLYVKKSKKMQGVIE
jgi:hypothetical protein